MNDVDREKNWHDSYTVCFIHKLNNNLHIRSHKHFSVFLSKHLVHKFKSNIFVNNPVSPYSFNLNSECLVILIAYLFTHCVLKVASVHIRTLWWRNLNNFFVISLFKNDCLFISHLNWLKSWAVKIVRKHLVINQIFENVFYYLNSRIIKLREELKNQIYHSGVIGFYSYM